MGKRKHSDEDEYNSIIKRLKKLEKKLKRSSKNRRDSSSSDSQNSVALPSQQEDGSMSECESMYINKNINTVDSESIKENCITVSESDNSRLEHELSPVASTSRVDLASTIMNDPQLGTELQIATASQSQTNISQLDKEHSIDKTVIELLGDDPSTTKLCGRDINPGLAIRIQHMVTNGIPKDTRKELQNKYLPPSNCMLIDAPILNPEIKAAVSEKVLKRDKGIELKQKMLGSAITCIGEAISNLLEKEDKDTELIKLLMDACRIISDCQNSDSVTRRNFVLYNLKKEIRNQLQKSIIDTSLFGSDLAETIKTAKTISKSGADLKSAPPLKTSAIRPNKPTPAPTTQRNLNWKAPPQNRRLKGNQELKEPVLRGQHTSSSRLSYRGPPSKNRSRR